MLQLSRQPQVVIRDLEQFALNLTVDQMQAVSLSLEEHLGTLELHVGALAWRWSVLLSLKYLLVLILKLLVFVLPERSISLTFLVRLGLVVEVAHFILQVGLVFTQELVLCLQVLDLGLFLEDILVQLCNDQLVLLKLQLVVHGSGQSLLLLSLELSDDISTGVDGLLEPVLLHAQGPDDAVVVFDLVLELGDLNVLLLKVIGFLQVVVLERRVDVS